MKKVIFGLLFGFLFIGFISANYNIVNKSLVTSYAQGDFFSGWTNVSFTDEDTTALFEDSLGNSIELLDLLNNQKDYVKECSPLDCSSAYSLVLDGTNQPVEEIEKKFTLNRGESKVVGIKFPVGLTALDSETPFLINILTNVEEKCREQLEIDFFADKKNVYLSRSPSPNFCTDSITRGCYDSKTPNQEDKLIAAIPYCQRIFFNANSKGIRMGGDITWKNYKGKIFMSLYGGEDIGFCELNEIDYQNEFGYYCDLEDSLFISAGEYYVCIHSEGGSPASLPTIKGYSDNNNGCGFFGDSTSGKSEIYAYSMFLEGKKFGVPEKIFLEDYGFNANEIESYLETKYGKIDCEGGKCFNCPNEGCIVPIKISSYVDSQEITLKDLELPIVTSGGVSALTKYVDLTNTPAKITSSSQLLFLKSFNFSIFGDFGKLSYSLNFTKLPFLSADFTIEKLSRILSLSPLRTASGFPTEFVAEMDIVKNITGYYWDFGNGVNLTGKSNKVFYTYSSPGEYNLTLTANSADGREISKIFKVTVVSPKIIIENMLAEFQDNLLNTTSQIKSLPSFYQTEIKASLKLDEADKEVKDLQKLFLSASSAEEYNPIITKLFELKVPEEITETDSFDGFSYYPSLENIDLKALQTAGGGSYDNEDIAVGSVFVWNKENLETKMNYREFSAKYSDVSSEPFLKFFELQIKDKGGLSQNPYLVMDELENLKFEKSYEEKVENGKVYINLNEEIKTISFSTTEMVDLFTLPLFISPSLDKLPLSSSDVILEEPKGSPRQFLLWLIIILIVLFGAVAYVILQIWYHKKYEDYLFKDKRKLHTLLNYIHNSKSRGIDDDSIISQLKKSGWESEQIDYALKKYLGKSTGMIGLPLDKLFPKKPAVSQPSGVQRGGFPLRR